MRVTLSFPAVKALHFFWGQMAYVATYLLIMAVAVHFKEYEFHADDFAMVGNQLAVVGKLVATAIANYRDMGRLQGPRKIDALDWLYGTSGGFILWALLPH